MPARQLPEHPSLENLRKQAKSLLREVHAGDPTALALVQEFHPHADEALAEFALNDAQVAVARSYGDANWTKLKQRVAAIEYSWTPPKVDVDNDTRPLADRFVDLACLNYENDWTERRVKARELLATDSSIPQENFYAAVAVGDVAATQRFLSADPSLATKRGGPRNWEPLLYACYSRLGSTVEGHSTLAVSRILLDHGADPNAGILWAGDYLFTALTGVFGEGERGPVNQPPHQYCFELARLLLERGADPNDSQTLYNKMFRPDNRHLELLFEFGLGGTDGGVWAGRIGEKVEENQRSMNDQLAWAVKHNFRERVVLLVEHHVDLNSSENRFSRVPYELAMVSGHRDIAEYLAEQGAAKKKLDAPHAFAAACISADADQARVLQSRDPKLIERFGTHRVALLQQAAGENNLAAIRLMAELGFNLNERSRTTALHEAASNGHLEMVKLLIELGADPRILDGEFNARPRGWAEYGYEFGATNKDGCRAVMDYLAQFEPAAPA
jgi:ankyrin repeat protein